MLAPSDHPALTLPLDPRLSPGATAHTAAPHFGTSSPPHTLAARHNTPAACIHHLFEQQAIATPRAVAAVFGGQRLTYQQLDERANQLARRLRQLGVGPESLVAVCLERSLDLLVSILGVWKAGGAYVPLDPAYPRERLAYMLEDTGVRALVTHEHIATRLPPHQARLVCLDAEGHALAQLPPDPPASDVGPGDLAYVIYTSGSTGRPKGVLLEHRGVGNLARFHSHEYGVGPGSRMLQFASASFDGSIFEISIALSSGATLYLAPKHDLLPGPDLARFLREQAITIAALPPTALAALPHEQFPALKTLIVAGEACPAELVRRWAPGRRFVNSYGPTEATVCATQCSYSPDEATPPIGRPIANTEVYVLDARQQPVPVGVAGELYIAGVGLARGYLNRPELSAERFLANPFSTTPGARMYRSGDLARFREDGALEFLGRIDHQVKVRGFRIELGEIEAVLSEFPGVRQCLVMAREDVPGQKRLVAYVEPETLAAAELKLHLRQRLPEHMVPASIVALAAFPLTFNRKIDRAALPPPAATRPDLGVPYVAPRSTGETALAAIWARLLRLDEVGVHDNFFELGGDSIQSISVVSAARQAGLGLTTQQLFQHPTIAELAALADTLPLAPAAPPAPAPADAERYPLTPMQHGMLYHTLYAPESGAYVVQSVGTLRGRLDVAAFQRAWQAMLDRHPALRTIFLWDEAGEPLQAVRPEATLPWRIEDWRALGPDEQESRLARLVKEDQARGFDLGQAPLLRVALLRVADDLYRCLWSFHHILLDGWSSTLLFDEAWVCYAALSAGAEVQLEPALPFREYVAWLRRQDGRAAEAFWRQRLDGVTASTPLAVDHPPSDGDESYAEHESVLSGLDNATIQAFTRAQRITFGTLAQAAWALLLSRYSGEEDVVFGATTSGRPAELAGVERMVGLCINTLPVRVRVPPGADVLTWLRQLQALQAEARQHEHASLADIQRWSAVGAGQPLFTSVLNVESYTGAHPGDARRAGELRLEALRVIERTNYPLSLSIGPGPLPTLRLIYDTRRFDAATVERMAGHLQTILAAIVAGPPRRLAELPMLTEAERRQLVVEWNTTGAERPECCAHELFAAQVARDPDAIALVFGDSSLTYGELDRRANQLAHHLGQYGLGPERLAGISLERSPEMVIALLAILKAGGAYLPLDPAYPQDRLDFMLADARPAVVLTSRRIAEQRWAHAQAASGSRVIALDADWPVIARQPATAPAGGATADTLAYVIYTSGSTGRPKGTLLQHRGLCNLAAAQQQLFAVGPGSRVLQFASLNFDASTWEIAMALFSGATLCLAPREQLLPGAGLERLLREQAITVATLPPSVLAVLAETEFPALETLIVAGEACPAELVRRWAPGRRFVNAYGPTEMTVCATQYSCSPDEATPSIGQPIANTEVYVLDARQRPVPVGVAGELYIAGVGLARGYLNRPELSAERFLANPFSATPGARMYRSGDLARFREDGALEFLGRIDHQVKVRGFRIELGEIDGALRRHPAVRDVIVLARERGAVTLQRRRFEDPATAPAPRPAGGEQWLVAYVLPSDPAMVGEGAAPALIAELRAFLHTTLPEYMVPAAFVLLEAFPLTPNGKVDRRALPDPSASPGAAPVGRAPQSATERRLARIWGELLGLEYVPADASFVELGGHSLLATTLHRRVRDTWRIDLPLRALFLTPTVAGLAAVIDAAQGHAPPAAALPVTTAELLADTLLDPAIQPARAAPTHGAPRAALLTGATGFLGAFLLHELLQTTGADVYCLVRAADRDAAARRVRASLEAYGLWDERSASRIVALPGDLAQPLLGQSPEAFQSLAATIDCIYHNGALVNFMYPYAMLRAANVLGTQEVLRLACEGRPKPVHLVSTVGALGMSTPAGGVLAEDQQLSLRQVVESGYVQSKWVAEKLALAARDRGLPVSIYRATRIWGHSATGAGNPDDFLFRLLKGCVQLGCAPDLSFQANLVPVDYVARAIIHLSGRPEAAGGVFHLANPRATEFGAIIDQARDYGYPLQTLPYEQWRAGLVADAAEDPGHALHTLIDFFPERQEDAGWLEFLGDSPINCRQTLGALAGTMITCPRIDTVIMHTQLAAAIQRGQLEPPHPPPAEPVSFLPIAPTL